MKPSTPSQAIDAVIGVDEQNGKQKKNKKKETGTASLTTPQPPSGWGLQNPSSHLGRHGFFTNLLPCSYPSLLSFLLAASAHLSLPSFISLPPFILGLTSLFSSLIPLHFSWSCSLSLHGSDHYLIFLTGSHPS